MRRIQITLVILILSAAVLPAQDLSRSLEFYFEDRAIVVPRFGANVEALPILELLGAEATYSPAAGTYGVAGSMAFCRPVSPAELRAGRRVGPSSTYPRGRPRP